MNRPRHPMAVQLGFGLLSLGLLACEASSPGGVTGGQAGSDAAADGQGDGGDEVGQQGDASIEAPDGHGGGDIGALLDGQESQPADASAPDGQARADAQKDAVEGGSDEPEVPCDDVPAGCGMAPEPGVRIDGAFADWDSVAPLMQDATGDAGSAAIDFGRVWVAHDPTWLFLRVEVGKVMNFQ